MLDRPHKVVGVAHAAQADRGVADDTELGAARVPRGPWTLDDVRAATRLAAADGHPRSVVAAAQATQQDLPLGASSVQLLLLIAARAADIGGN